MSFFRGFTLTLLLLVVFASALAIWWGGQRDVAESVGPPVGADDNASQLANGTNETNASNGTIASNDTNATSGGDAPGNETAAGG